MITADTSHCTIASDDIKDATGAINEAILACGKDKTLILDDGWYGVRPGDLYPMECSVYGPGAVLFGLTPIDRHIVRLNYQGETIHPVIYDDAFSGPRTGYRGNKTFKIYQINGFNPLNKKNCAIYCEAMDEAVIDVEYIRGASIGIFMDGGSNEKHMGTNTIRFGTIGACGIGVAGFDGTGGHGFEANRITGNYIYEIDIAAITLAGGGGAGKYDNIIDVLSIGVTTPGAHGILLDASCMRNKITVRSWDSGVSGGGKLIQSSGTDNILHIPNGTFGDCIFNGSDTVLTADSAIGGYGVSRISGAAPPTTGLWRNGSVCHNIAPAIGQPTGWIFVAGSGWRAMPNLN